MVRWRDVGERWRGVVERWRVRWRGGGLGGGI